MGDHEIPPKKNSWVSNDTIFPSSFLNSCKSYHPQKFLEECKYKEKIYKYL